MRKSMVGNFEFVLETRGGEQYIAIGDTLISLDGSIIKSLDEYNEKLYHLSEFNQDIVRVYNFNLGEDSKPILTGLYDVGDCIVSNFTTEGDSTTLYFEDGSRTRVTRHKDDEYDVTTAVLYALAKRFVDKKEIERLIDEVEKTYTPPQPAHQYYEDRLAEGYRFLAADSDGTNVLFKSRPILKGGIYVVNPSCKNKVPFKTVPKDKSVIKHADGILEFKEKRK